MLDTDVCWGQSCSTFLSVSQGQSLFETLKPLWGLTHSDNPVLGPSGSWVLPHQLSSAETSVSLREAWELAKRGKNVLWEYSFRVFLLILGILWVTPTPKPMDSWQWITIRGLQVPIFVVNLNFFTVTALWAVQGSFWRRRVPVLRQVFFYSVSRYGITKLHITPSCGLSMTMVCTSLVTQHTKESHILLWFGHKINI